MYNGAKVIDVHGHMSTPPHFRAFGLQLISQRSGKAKLEITPEQMKGALDRHFGAMDARGIDVQLVSPRPIAMLHWEANFLQQRWARITNDVIHQQCQMHPDRLAGVAQLPQSRESDTSNCVAEFERCVKDLGFVGALVNPDPGADRQTPGMNDPYWFPLYEKAQALQATLLIHPSISRDPRIEILDHNYQYNNLTEEALATLLLEQSDVFERFPELRIVVAHCGGALRRMLPKGTRRASESTTQGSQFGMAVQQEGGAGGAERDLSRNLFFDTCAYDKYFLGAAIQQRGVDRMVFGTEAPGTGSGPINPDTGKPSDDLIPVLEGMDFLTDHDRVKIVHENPKKVYPLLKIG